MERFHDIRALRKFLAQARRTRPIAFVPTMGALHRGHGACVSLAREGENPLVVCSVFVNPSQFGPKEDFSRYPRTLEADAALLTEWGCDVLFAPEVPEMYPEPQTLWVEPGPLAGPLDGRFRPGHFRGVATVVAKLFDIVEPDVAVFGQKDAQQALVVRSMVVQLNMRVMLRLARTVREDDGLAVSSRNSYLDPFERRQAAAIYASLDAVRKALQSGERDTRRLEATAKDVLERASVRKIDYVELRAAHDLSALAPAKGRAILAIAAHVGGTRLIDNMVFQIGDGYVDADVMLY